MKRATVELDHDALPAIAHILEGGPACRSAADLTLTAGQPVGPLDPVQVATLEHRTCAVTKIVEHRLQHAPAANTLTARQRLQDPLRSRPPVGTHPRQHRECGRHIVRAELVADHVDQRVLQANRRWAAVEFGASGEVGHPMQHDSWQWPQIARCVDGDVNDRRRRIGQRRRVSQRRRPERQHRDPMPLRLCEPPAVVHVDAPTDRCQFASAHQSGDVAIGASGDQNLAAGNDSLLAPGQVIDTPETPASHTGKRDRTTIRRPSRPTAAVDNGLTG